MKQIDFENGSTPMNILQTALPMFVAQVINLLYSIVDRIYIGRIPGEGTIALGGIGLCFPIITLITAFTNLYGSGGSPLFSMARGAKDRQNAERIINTSFRLEIITGLLLTAIIGLAGRPILYMFGASDSSIVYALPYLRIYVLGTVFVMIATGMNPFINAQGFSQIGMITVVIGAVANIILDPIFIFIFDMGVQGAALATIISQGLSAVFAMRFLIGKSSPAEYKLKLRGVPLLPELATTISIVSLGIAAFIMQFTNSLVTAVSNTVLSGIGGDLYVSIMTIVSSLRQVLELPALSITEGASPVISYNYGARRPKKTREAIFVMSVSSGLYTLIGWICVEIFPRILLAIFTSDAELITAAEPALHLYFMAFIGMALQHSGQTTFKALGKRRHAIFFSIFRKVILVVPLAIILPHLFGLGTDGVFIAEPISNVVGGSAAFITMLITVLPELKRMEAEQ